MPVRTERSPPMDVVHRASLFAATSPLRPAPHLFEFTQLDQAVVEATLMVDGLSNASRTEPSWQREQHEYDKPQPGAARKNADNVANAPWLTDPSRLGTTAPLPAAVFSQPATGGPAVALAAPAAAAVPPDPAAAGRPLAAAANARTGITLANLAEGLPRGTHTDPARVMVASPYRLYPEVSKGADGKDAVHYWTAYNTETKRVEFVVGPGSLQTFKTEPKLYAVAAANGFMGEQDAATRESAKVVEVGMREGFGAAFHQLGKAWRAAGSDPKWVVKTAFNVVTASSGGPTKTRATCAEAGTEIGAAGAAAELSPAAPAARAHTLADINPGGPTAPGRSLNCVNCAVATDASYAGNPATAMPSETTLRLTDVTNATGGSFVAVRSPADIEAALLRSGPGSRAIVAATRQAPDPGHVFNAVNVEGRVYFVDGQTGGAAVFDPSYQRFGMLQTSPRKP